MLDEHGFLDRVQGIYNCDETIVRHSMNPPVSRTAVRLIGVVSFQLGKKKKQETNVIGSGTLRYSTRKTGD